MPHNTRRVLLLYTDKYYLIKQVYPYGLDLIANHLRRFGYDVIIESPFLASSDPQSGLNEILDRTEPDVIGLGIRNLDTAMSCEKFGNYEGTGFKTFYFLPEIKQIVESIRRQIPEIPIVAGGGAFTVSPEAILRKLDIPYGILGEGEEPLHQLLLAFPDEEKMSGIPNVIVRRENQFFSTPRQPYTFKPDETVMVREKKFNYAFESAGIPVQLKRGCNQSCSYCVEPIIEGRQIVFRDQDAVISELQHLGTHHDGVKTVFYTDTEFNIPSLEYGKSFIRRLIETGLHERFRFSSQFLPRPFDAELARLLEAAGFSVILTCDSFSDGVLENNGSAFRQADIIKTLELCEAHQIDCGVNLIFGLPGETFKTIDHTIEKMLKLRPHGFRRYEYTIGGRIYRGTPLCRFVENRGGNGHLYGNPSEGYLEPYYFCSPASPMELKEYIDGAVPLSLEFQNNYDDVRCQGLRLSYLIDQCMWQAAETGFLSGDLAVQTSIYEYFFRKLAGSGKFAVAKRIGEHLMARMLHDPEKDIYTDQISVISYYLSVLAAAEPQAPD